MDVSKMTPKQLREAIALADLGDLMAELQRHVKDRRLMLEEEMHHEAVRKASVAGGPGQRSSTQGLPSPKVQGARARSAPGRAVGGSARGALRGSVQGPPLRAIAPEPGEVRFGPGSRGGKVRNAPREPRPRPGKGWRKGSASLPPVRTEGVRDLAELAMNPQVGIGWPLDEWGHPLSPEEALHAWDA